MPESNAYQKMTGEVATNGFRQFLVLLYKGYLFRKRHYIVTAFEIVVPVLIASIPVIIQSEMLGSLGCRTRDHMRHNENKWENASFYPEFDPLTSGQGSVTVLYSPSDELPAGFANKTFDTWVYGHRYSARYEWTIEGFKTEEELEDKAFFLQQSHPYDTIVGLVFNNMDGKKLPDSLDYKIRYGGSQSFFTGLKYRINGPQRNNPYRDTMFLSWQAAVEQTFIEEKMKEKGKSISYELRMNRFPYPAHKKNNDDFNAISIISWVIGYGFLIFIVNAVRRVTEEKSNRTKELLKMMGMKDLIYWSSTFTNFFSVGAFSMLIIAIVYKSPVKCSMVFLENTDFFLLFILLLLFMAQLILFCFAFTTFFNKPVFAIVLILVIYNSTLSVFSTLYFMVFNNDAYFQLSLGSKLGICLLPTGSLLTIFSIISTLENNGMGALWTNLTEYNASFDVNMLMVIGTMIFACFLYIIIIWYVDAVWPWQLGVPKPFYFPFTKSYWCGYQEPDEDDDDIIEEKMVDTELFEEEPTNVPAGVHIRNLTKVFRTGMTKKHAVNNVSLNIYNGQITALLGHNGAGKTTTINILTGLYTPSSGTATVNGWDILKETTKARRSLGVCPQENILYDTLTAEEHLKIYAGLKGVKWSELSSQAADILKVLQLTDKKNELVKTLSGGMKRKLSLGIALIGGSKVLFLDEPTSGMDVEARRSVWDALLTLRHDRTIILTTHYMEEADILGDRVAIMADGEIQCCGSPMFLKRKFGTGYHLHLVKDRNFNQSGVLGLIQKHIPGSSVENSSEKEITFNLGSNSDSSFARMFEELENSKSSMGFNSCGITVTTMDDVFLKVSMTSEVKENVANGVSLENAYGNTYEDVYSEANDVPKVRSVGHLMWGLLIKRFNYTKRHWLMLLAHIVLPFLLMCLCLGIISATSYTFRTTYPPLKMDIKEIYGDTDGFYSTNETTNTFGKTMKKVMEGNSISVAETTNPIDYILKKGEKNIVNYLKNFHVGGSVNKDRTFFIAWYNGEPYHSLPISLSMMNTAILKETSGSGSITLTNAPLPTSYRSYISNSIISVSGSIAFAIVPIAFAYVAASYVMVPIQERASKAKLLQLMTGLHEWLYWLSMFIWDGLLHVVVSIVLIIPFAIFSRYAFFSPHSDAIGTALLMMFLYGWSSIPLTYIISLIFKKPNTGFTAVTMTCVITGTVAGSILSALQQYDGVKKAVWFFRIFPSYCIGSGFSNLFTLAYTNSFCESIPSKDLKLYCASQNKDKESLLYQCCTGICGNRCLQQKPLLTWAYESCGRDTLFLAVDGFLYIGLLLLLDSLVFRRFMKLVRQRTKRGQAVQILQENISEDSDVLAEEERIRSATEWGLSNEALFVRDLTKSYRNFYAVDHLTFGIQKQECFGLLGVNGAGKTTTFRMLTGDCSPSDGNGFSSDLSIVSQTKKFQSLIGYCPQFDALIDRLTGREMITLFARLRGMNGPSMTNSVDKLIKMTDLTQHADKQTRFYSGGNKRKLSIAIALIGSPPLILLDEPTAGVDPVSRRKIWNILAQARRVTGASIILTTHSMEESEALCARLAIMVNGRFRCLGSIQQLKSKFGQGYTLIIKMKKEMQGNTEHVNVVKNFVSSSLPGSQLKDDQQAEFRASALATIHQRAVTEISYQKIVIFVDSQAAIQSITDYNLFPTETEFECKLIISSLLETSKDVVLQWIPSYEQADLLG
ncbi:phospholipid-transporting ATPase ABCA3-like [Uloborus diversus]|uniref:phospholipid-transporting ATPase ABCA3-like n=1 Tax=Uloborus diversus TaxID=327109 RepID=UPI0024094F1F|nr:phospholipid-transporting ATPase ABCA3-like [Uloborus diversus]